MPAEEAMKKLLLCLLTLGLLDDSTGLRRRTIRLDDDAGSLKRRPRSISPAPPSRS